MKGRENAANYRKQQHVVVLTSVSFNDLSQKSSPRFTDPFVVVMDRSTAILAWLRSAALMSLILAVADLFSSKFLLVKETAKKTNFLKEY